MSYFFIEDWEATLASWLGLPSVLVLHSVEMLGAYAGKYKYEDDSLLGCCAV
jgi:hypothetical protein